jgi:glutathione S-transferase
MTATTATTAIRLYDLTTEDDRRPSPFCWRAKYALAHKGLPFTTVPVGFLDIPGLGGGGHQTVPILDDGGRIVGDSWAIADYLDQAYPDRPPIFATAAERALCRFFESSLFMSAVRPLLMYCVKDIHDHALESDRAYFRATREKWLGRTLEAVAAEREEHRRAARQGLAAVRSTLAAGAPFLSGQSPGYADYMVAGFLLWPASVATLPFLTADDSLLPWLARVQDLYDGLGRKSPLYALAESGA